MFSLLYHIFAETERRIRANDREYNSQFNYAVREKYLLIIFTILSESYVCTIKKIKNIYVIKKNLMRSEDDRNITNILLFCRIITSRRPSIRF